MSPSDWRLTQKPHIPTTTTASTTQGDVAWFLNGKLNASACCIDQHLPQREEQVAIIWEGDEPGDCKYITYKVRPGSRWVVMPWWGGDC
jgi:hypothetical protein